MALVFKRDKFLNKSELQSDGLYLWKDGHVRLFLGIDNSGKMVFYSIGILDLRDRNWSEIFILHEEVALIMLEKTLKLLLDSRTFETNAIERYATLPSIYACLKKNVCRQYSHYENTIELCKTYPAIFGEITNPNKRAKGSVYVSAKDLVVGGVYHTGEDCWRKTYCFMGRNTSTGEFIWMFIGNAEAFRRDPYEFYRQYHPPIEYLKHNKKVRPVTPEKSKVLGGFNAVLMSSAFATVCERCCLSRSYGSKPLF